MASFLIKSGNELNIFLFSHLNYFNSLHVFSFLFHFNFCFFYFSCIFLLHFSIINLFCSSKIVLVISSVLSDFCSLFPSFWFPPFSVVFVPSFIHYFYHCCCSFFLYIPFKMWAIINLHNVLSSVALRNFNPLPPIFVPFLSSIQTHCWWQIVFHCFSVFHYLLWVLLA